MSKSAYPSSSWLVSLILAIIPITNIILGIVTRIQKGKLILAVLNFFFFFVFYWVDLISVILNKDLDWLV